MLSQEQLVLLLTLIRVESYVAKKLKLEVEPVSTQIIPRDRHAQFFNIRNNRKFNERFAVEIRHLQRTEVLEVEEFLVKNKKALQLCLTKKIQF